jgi:hypothetical protein
VNDRTDLLPLLAEIFFNLVFNATCPFRGFAVCNSQCRPVLTLIPRFCLFYFEDCYIKNFLSGSNNRLDEANRDRNNANRLFDSQNNNRGGYNVGQIYYGGIFVQLTI